MNNNMQLIIDAKTGKPLQVDSFGNGKFRAKILSEAVYNDNKKIVTGMVVEGILQRADSINQNGRKYPRRILIREAQKYKTTYIRESRSYGELDHPDSSVVSMQTASHWVQDLWWVGNDLWGRIELLDTPCGRIVETVLKRGLTIGISSRGLGSVKPLHEEDETVEVQDDFEILSWDFVSNPSTQNAFMRPVNALHEGVNYKANANDILLPEYKYGKVNTLIKEIITDLG